MLSERLSRCNEDVVRFPTKLSVLLEAKKVPFQDAMTMGVLELDRPLWSAFPQVLQVTFLWTCIGCGGTYMGW